MYLCLDGEWINIVIDDFIPCRNNKPAFSKAKDKELWVILLEKAYAKMYGNYDKIEAGLTGQAIRDLTGKQNFKL